MKKEENKVELIFWGGDKKKKTEVSILSDKNRLQNKEQHHNLVRGKLIHHKLMNYIDSLPLYIS